MLKRLSIILLLSMLTCGMVQANEKTVATEIQTELRSSYPFPEFLFTGPYVWYEDAERQAIRGHAYRIVTFTVDSLLRVYLEKVIFGVDGCCIELVESRELKISQAELAALFPKNSGEFGFKVLNWRDATSFIFTAHGGQYLLTEIDTIRPKIIETTANE